MVISPGLFSSNSDDWETPQKLFDSLDAEFGPFTLDPCASDQNYKCDKYFTVDDDGLEQDWSSHKVFMNPPYGRVISKWYKKAYNEAKKGAMVVGLVPARTDTIYWHKYAWLMKGVTIRLLKGRVKFGNSKAGAPFPSAIIIWRKNLEGNFKIIR